MIAIGATTVSQQLFGSSDSRSFLTVNECDGSQDGHPSVGNCSFMLETTSTCEEPILGIVCQPQSAADFSNCTDGDIRLVDGGSPIDGRVEVCVNRAWGTVCDNLFGADEAEVICAQLGHPRAGKIMLHFSPFTFLFFELGAKIYHFGEGSGPIFMDQLNCMGTEPNILDCYSFAPLGVHTCDHSQDSGVYCEGTAILKH